MFKTLLILAPIFMGTLLTTSGHSAQVAKTKHPAYTNVIQQIKSSKTKKDPISPLHWDWKTIDIAKTHFKKDFLFGVATSAHQVEGDSHNSWTDWEESCDEQKKPRVQHVSGKACEHWKNYKEDIQLIKKLGVKAYRFSIAWDKVEPSSGKFNQEALKHYQDVCDELIVNDIQPVITLHHYTDPLWFFDRGGFEKEENIKYFVRFCKTVFSTLHPRVHMWFTFNSPDGYAFKGYHQGMVPPGKKDMNLACIVYKNLLEAHVQTYNALKQLAGKTPTRIGILKNMIQIDPWRNWNILDIMGCSAAKKLTDDCFFNFFTTGVFNVKIPFKVTVRHTNNDAPASLDFIGLNYYSHMYMSNFKIIKDPQEIATQNSNYVVYPEGLYRAIKTISDELDCQGKKNIRKNILPIYVTENGIATDDDNLRTLFTQRYLYALSEAIEDGYDVRGYIHWSLMDNYEWGSYDKHYGIYAVDFKTQKRTIKPGARYFVDLVKYTYQIA